MIRHQLKLAAGTYTNHLLTRTTTTLAFNLLTLTTLSYLTLSFSLVSADTVDNVSVTVPSSCSLTSTLDSAHTETINIGTNVDDIGTTTLKVFCNDSEGFAIYAAGYTGDVIGGTNSNKLIGTNNQTSIGNIDTGIATSGATSNWSMKLIKVENEQGQEEVAYNPANLTIESDTNGSFANYHVVPNEYTKVASFTSTTDATLGSVLQTTYQAYISPTQTAGTYAGKVIYTLVHPSTAIAPVKPNQIGVNYNANGSSFTGGTTTNNVVYAMSPMYIATTPTISKSPNVVDENTQNGGNVAGTDECEKTTITGATKLKVEIKYDLTTDGNTQIYYVDQAVDNWDDATNWQELPEGTSGTETIVIVGDSITFNTYTENDSNDYGYYAKIYPLYATEQPNTEASSEFASLTVDTGTYATTTNWYGSWYADINNVHYDFMDEAEVISFLGDNVSTLSGTTIDLMRGLTFTEAYTRANKTQDNGYYKQQELTKSMCNTIAITQNQTLKDTRDNSTYMVGKLKDGNCWMLDNMALDLTDANVLANVTEQNTHASATSLNYLKNGGGTQYDRYAITGVVEWSESPYYYNGRSFSDPLVATSGDCYDSVNCANDPAVGKWTKDSLPPNQNGQSTHYGVGSGKIGIYYNYCAVSAGSYCYGNGASISGGPFGDALEDICPRNWRMPTGSYYASGEFKKLVAAYNSNLDASSADSFQYNFSVTLSGEYSYYGHPTLALVAYGQGFGGEFWSSTGDLYSDQVSYYLEVFSNSIGNSFVPRTDGRSLRCLVGN